MHGVTLSLYVSIPRTFASFETGGFDGNSTLRAFIIVSSRRILSWVWSCPKGRLPKSIWYNITPADHTSTWTQTWRSHIQCSLSMLLSPKNHFFITVNKCERERERESLKLTFYLRSRPCHLIDEKSDLDLIKDKQFRAPDSSVMHKSLKFM